MSDLVESALAGRRELALLESASARHAAEVIAEVTGSAFWVRSVISTLDRFAALVAGPEPGALDALITKCQNTPGRAAQLMETYYAALPACTDTQLSALSIGAKVWFRLNGVQLPWLAPSGPAAATRITGQGRGPAADSSRVLLLALINSGMSPEEAMAVRLGDVGSLDQSGQVIPDRYADPLAVRYLPIGDDGQPHEPRVTFLHHEARVALTLSWAARELAGGDLSDESPLIAGPTQGGDPIATARARHEALIGAGHEVNVFMCRMTGDFFRQWGMPGEKFHTRRGEAPVAWMGHQGS